MGEVVDGNFANEKSGYVTKGDSIEGVYNGSLCAVLVNGSKDKCTVGYTDDERVIGIEMTVKEMNEFCLMWLCIFDESVIVKEKGDDN